MKITQTANNSDASVLMKPEGSVKIVVLNGSRPDRPGCYLVRGKDGEPGWVTMKGYSQRRGLPKGIPTERRH